MDINQKGRLYYVQSTKNKNVSYEVCIPGLTCTCNAYRYKMTLCKHIKEVCARIADGGLNVDKSNSIMVEEAKKKGKI